MKLFESAKTLAFLDIQPLSMGHSVSLQSGHRSQRYLYINNSPVSALSKTQQLHALPLQPAPHPTSSTPHLLPPPHTHPHIPLPLPYSHTLTHAPTAHNPQNTRRKTNRYPGRLAHGNPLRRQETRTRVRRNRLQHPSKQRTYRASSGGSCAFSYDS